MEVREGRGGREGSRREVRERGGDESGEDRIGEGKGGQGRMGGLTCGSKGPPTAAGAAGAGPPGRLLPRCQPLAARAGHCGNASPGTHSVAHGTQQGTCDNRTQASSQGNSGCEHPQVWVHYQEGPVGTPVGSGVGGIIAVGILILGQFSGG